MTRPQPTPASRRIDPNSPRGARRTALMWNAYVVFGLLMAGLLTLAWNLAQEHHYEDNLRGFEYGDPYPTVAVALCFAFSAFALVMSVVKWARYLRMRRES
jgi:hypothetical protein